jgi:hypothetical protein
VDLNRRQLLRLPLRTLGPASDETGPAARPIPEAPPDVSILACSPHELTEAPFVDADVLRGMRGMWPVLWVRVVGGSAHGPVLERLRAVLGYPAAFVERLTDPVEPVALERGGEHLAVRYGSVAVVGGPDHVVSLVHGGADPFAELAEALRSPRAGLRGGDAAALAVAMLERLIPLPMHEVDEAARALERVAGDTGERARGRAGAIRAEMARIERSAGALSAGLRRWASDPHPGLPADLEPRLERMARDVALAGAAARAGRERSQELIEELIVEGMERLDRALRRLAVVAGGLLAVLAVALLLLATGALRG